MTVPATTRRVGPHLGNGVTTSFPFSFKVFAASDIAMTHVDADGISYALSLGTDYSVTLNADQDATPGGTITYPLSGDPLATGETLVGVGALPYDQSTDLPSGGAYRALSVENAFDRTVQQIQQLAEAQGRSLTLPASAATANTELPAPAANKIIGWNETGDALTNRSPADLATVVVAGTSYFQVFNGTGSQTQFVLTADPGSVNALDIAVDGVPQKNGIDFTVSGTTLTFTSAPAAGTQNIAVRYVAAVPVGSADAQDVTFSPTGPNASVRTLQSKLRDVVHVNDWGGDLKMALQNVAEYTTIMLDAATYDISGIYSHDFNFGAGPFVGNTKRGIRLQGANMPRVNSTGTALEGGTVIQGTLFNLADDFEAYDLGVDVGSAVCAAKYGGAYAEGFVPGANTSYPTVQPTIKGVAVDRVIALGDVPTGSAATFKHTMLFENMEDTKIGMVEAVGGYHAFVSKVVNLQANSIMARGGAAGEAVIFKSDVANRCEDNQIAQLRIDNWFKNGVEQKAGCLRFEAIDNVNGHVTAKIKIGVCTIKNLDAGVDGIKASGTYPIVDCGIGHLNADTAGASVAALRMGYASSDIRRFVIGSHNIVTAGRSFELGPGWVEGHIGSGSQKFTADALQPLMTFDSSSYTHGVIQMTIDAAQTNTYMIQRTAGDVRIDLITIGGSAFIPLSRYLSSYGGTFTLNATNAVDSAISAFGVAGIEYVAYNVKLKGAVKTLNPGSRALFTVAPAPLVTIRRTVSSQTAALAFVQRTLEIAGGTGVCTVLDAATTANDYIFLDEIEYNPLTR